MQILVVWFGWFVALPAYLVYDVISDEIRDRALRPRRALSWRARLRLVWSALRALRPSSLLPSGPGEVVLFASWLIGLVVIGAAVISEM